MLNEELQRKVTSKEFAFFKLHLQRGDYDKMAKKFNCHWTKFSRAIASKKATPTTISQMTKFFQSKKVPA